MLVSFSLVLMRRSQSSARANTDFLTTDVEGKLQELKRLSLDRAGVDVLSDEVLDREAEWSW